MITNCNTPFKVIIFKEFSLFVCLLVCSCKIPSKEKNDKSAVLILLIHGENGEQSGAEGRGREERGAERIGEGKE